jgi:hypothetical protein
MRYFAANVKSEGKRSFPFTPINMRYFAANVKPEGKRVASRLFHSLEPVPKLIDCALTRTVLGKVFAVFHAFSLAKLRILRLLSQKLKFWESLIIKI